MELNFVLMGLLLLPVASLFTAYFGITLFKNMWRWSD